MMISETEGLKPQAEDVETSRKVDEVQQPEEKEEIAGSCFIVGAPIEEREDITQRGIRALQSADFVVTGDERHAATLMKRYAISKKLLGIGPEVEQDVLEVVLAMLRDGKRVVILSAPSFMIFPALGRLIAGIREAGLEPRVMPGVDVAKTAIVMSGFPSYRYYVAGRLPGRRSGIEDFARNVARIDVTVVIEGGTDRLRSSLQIFGDAMPQRPAAVILRPTVPGEVIKRGRMAELPEYFGDSPFSGDWVLVLGPNEFDEDESRQTAEAEPRESAEQEQTQNHEEG